jgi:hypothetical protein
MIFPPLLMRLHIRDSRRHINLWLPLFLVWFVLVVLLLALLPLLLIAALVLLIVGLGRLVRLAPVVYRCLCALHGLRVDVRQSQERVLIYFI